MGLQLDTYLTNIETASDSIAESRERIDIAQKGLESMSRTIDVIEHTLNSAKTLESMAETLKTASKLIERFPPVKFIATGVNKIVTKIESRVEDLRKDIEGVEKNFSKYTSAIEVMKVALLATDLDLANKQGDINAVIGSLKDTKAAFDLSAAGAPDLEATAEAKIETLLGGLNAEFPQTALNALTDRTQAMATAFEPYVSLADSFTFLDKGFNSIISSIGFLVTPLKVINDALAPVAWVFNAVGWLIDAVVNPILDPILNALGVNTLIDNIAKAVTGLLPNTGFLSAFDNLDADFTHIFGSPDLPDFSFPLLDDLNTTLGDINADINATPPGEALIARIFGTDGILAPLLGAGTSNADLLLGVNDIFSKVSTLQGSGEQDVLSGGAGNDNLGGDAGDDVLVNGEGNDFFDGGAGNDVLVCTAPIEQMTWRFETKSMTNPITGLSVTAEFLILNHHPPSGAGLGEDTVMNVEYVIFGSSAFTVEQLRSAIRVNYGEADGQIRYGTSSGDVIIGGNLADELHGRRGNDFFIPMEGFDYVDGGAGIDTVSYASEPGTSAIVILDPKLFAQFGRTDDILNVENIVGTQNQDIIVGSADDNYLDGGGDADQLVGGRGNDRLVGGDGGDYLSGGRGNDLVRGGAGMDFIVGGRGNDTYIGDDGSRDVLTYGSHSPSAWSYDLTGSLLSIIGQYDAQMAGDLPQSLRLVSSGNGEATVVKYNGNGKQIGRDTLMGDFALLATDGADRINYGAGNSIYDGGDGGDTFRGYDITTIPELGTKPVNLLFGGAGNDTFVTPTVEDHMIGGDGDDTFRIIGQTLAKVTTEYLPWVVGGNLPAGYLTPNAPFLPTDWNGINEAAFAALDTGHDILDLSKSGVRWDVELEYFGAWTTVDDWNSQSYGFALLGIDEIIGSNLKDAFGFAFRDVTIRAGDGDDRIRGAYRSTANTELYGNAGNDRIYTESGVDHVYGGAGNDLLEDAGNTAGGVDVLKGNSGDDLFEVNPNSTGTYDADGGVGRDAIFLTDPEGVAVGPAIIDLRQGFFSYAGKVSQIRSFEYAFGGDSDDTITGGNRADGLNGNSGNDVIEGRAGDDILVGDYYYAGGSDSVYGGGGNDIINPGTNSSAGIVDYADGGAGDDLLSFAVQLNFDAPLGVTLEYIYPHSPGSLFAWTIDVGSGQATSSTGGTVTFERFERYQGGIGDDALLGSSAGDILDGHNGNDTIQGEGGDDAILGGFGDDMLFGGDGDDSVDMGQGNDRADGGAGTDLLSFGDTYIALAVNTQSGVAVGTYNDSVWNYDSSLETWVETFTTSTDNMSFSNFEIYDLSQADDTFDGNAADETIYGKAGNDTLNGGGGGDTINGGDGDDVIYGDRSTRLHLGAMNPEGSAKTDYVYNPSFIDMPTSKITVELLMKADPLVTSSKVIMSYATAGSYNEFTLFNDDSPSGSQLRLWINNASYDTGVPSSLIYDGDLHRLSFSWDGTTGEIAIYVDGTEEFRQTYAAMAGTSIAGDGFLVFGQDQDSLGGGYDPGQSFTGAMGDIRIFNGIRTAAEIAQNAADVLSGDLTAVPGLVANWNYDPASGTYINALGVDLLTSSASGLSDVLAYDPGTAGDDTLSGGAGNDQIFGEDGNDVVQGGAGADAMDGGDGIDTLDYSGSNSGVTVNLESGTGIRGDATGDTFTRFENVTGSSFDDILIGDAADNALVGTGGDDILRGLAGADDLGGGAGSDTASYVGSDDGVAIDLAAGSASGGHAMGDRLGSIENLEGSTFADLLSGDVGANVLEGKGGADVLEGRAGDDTLDGGNGADRLEGGDGHDTLTGGQHQDVFVLSALETSSDIITDFDAADDQFEIAATEFDGLPPLGTLPAARFVINTTGLAGDANDRFVFNSATNELFFDSNGDAAGGSRLIATFTTTPVGISASDFDIV